MTPPDSKLKKASQSFRRARRKPIPIIFAGDMRVGKNTARPASVEFLRSRKNYARGRVQAFSNESPAKRVSFESFSKIYF